MKHPLETDLNINHNDGDMYGDPISKEKLMPSEMIMPYLQRYFMCRLEELAYFNTKPEKVIEGLEELARFVRFTCGIHASLAFSNEVNRLKDIPVDKLKEIIKETFLD